MRRSRYQPRDHRAPLTRRSARAEKKAKQAYEALTRRTWDPRVKAALVRMDAALERGASLVEALAAEVRRGKAERRGERDVTVVNPNDANFYDHKYVLWFGQIAPTRLLVYARSLEDAFEEAVDYIADNAPGLLADEQVEEAYREALDEAADAGDDINDEEVIERAREAAEADTSQADGHYVNSDEWGIYLEDPSPRQLFDFRRGR